jgi:hypothetical protein
MPQKKKQSTMSSEHKAALAQGRNESRSVRLYLEALEAHKPKRGRKRTAESITKRLDTIAIALAEADPVSRLHLVQERLDLSAELAHTGAKIDLTELEADFVAVAAGYSERRGISYAAWRELGVEAAVLKKAAIGRGGH